MALGRRFAGYLPFEGCAFYAKRDREFRIDLPTIFVLEVREEDFFETFDGILSIGDDIEGDSC